MKYYRLVFLIAILTVALMGCKDDTTGTSTTQNGGETEVLELRNRVAQLELQNLQKDSVINETISFFNEVQMNLAKISIKEDEIRIKSSNPEISQEDQEWILQEIQNINFLREQNAKQISSLQKQIADNKLEIEELNGMINRLVLQIKDKDEHIAVLQRALVDKDMEYAALFDEYQGQVELALDVMKELNTVYYAYGTRDELVDNHVIVREGGFIGMGKKTNIADDFNDGYFEKLDKTKIFEITVIGKKPKIITDHPVASYEWEGNKLKIRDAEMFWKVSNYLVIEVK